MAMLGGEAIVLAALLLYWRVVMHDKSLHEERRWKVVGHVGADDLQHA